MIVWHKMSDKMYWWIADKVNRFHKANMELVYKFHPSLGAMYGIEVQNQLWKITETQKTGPKEDVKRSYSSAPSFWVGSVHQWVLRRAG